MSAIPPGTASRVRPLPGATAAGAATGARTRWDGIRGWPDGLPVDRRLDERVAFELQRTSIKRELVRRSRGRLADTRDTLAIFGLGVLVLHFSSEVTDGLLLRPLLAFAVHAVVVGGYGLWAACHLVRRFRAPHLRAMLRRNGVDCCIGCGFLMARGEPADTCPECGREHADFPIGWGPGPIAGTAAAVTHPAAGDTTP